MLSGINSESTPRLCILRWCIDLGNPNRCDPTRKFRPAIWGQCRQLQYGAALCFFVAILDKGFVPGERRTLYFSHGQRATHRDPRGVIVKSEFTEEGLERLYALKEGYSCQGVAYGIEHGVKSTELSGRPQYVFNVLGMPDRSQHTFKQVCRVGQPPMSGHMT